MFKSPADRITATIFVILFLLTPVLTFLLAKRIGVSQMLLNPGFEKKETILATKKTSDQAALDELRSKIQATANDSEVLAAHEEPTTPTFFGPVLKFKVSLEGRPSTNQTTKLFIGFVGGGPTANPQYLVSYIVKLKEAGEIPGISISGLTTGETYTAYIKSSSQIATAISFVMKPTINDLGSLNLTSGDLNEDNQIDNSDLALAKQSFGATPGSLAWNPEADFNQDGVINNGDLSILAKNLGKIGASGAWEYSPLKNATASEILGVNVGGEASFSAQQASSSALPSGKLPSGQEGHWLWIPEL